MSQKRKRNVKLIAIFGLTAVLLITTGWSVMASVESEPVFVPSGVYVCFEEGGQIWTDMVIPNDPAGNTTTHVEDFLVVDPTLGGMFPEADTRRSALGRGVRIGPESWQVTWIQYGAKGLELQYVLLYCAVVTFSEDGETMFFEWTAECYLPEHDVDGDGFPDEGQEPFAARPGTATLRRVPLRPLYEPPQE
jgi:hypothetical protein